MIAWLHHRGLTAIGWFTYPTAPLVIRVSASSTGAGLGLPGAATSSYGQRHLVADRRGSRCEGGWVLEVCPRRFRPLACGPDRGDDQSVVRLCPALSGGIVSMRFPTVALGASRIGWQIAIVTLVGLGIALDDQRRADRPRPERLAGIPGRGGVLPVSYWPAPCCLRRRSPGLPESARAGVRYANRRH